MKYLSLDGVKYLWSKIKARIANENLLINSDFRDPINQRGNTSYSGKVYTVDRWIADVQTDVSVQDGYLRLKLNNDSAWLIIRQNIEMKPEQIPATLTLSFRARASVASVAELYTTKRYINIGTDWATYSITFTKDEIGDSIGATSFAVYAGIKNKSNPDVAKLAKGTTFDVQWIKLEAGNGATPFVPRNKAEELKLCQRYYIKYSGWNNAVMVRGDHLSLIAYIPNLSMRINPTVKNAGLKASGLANGSGVADQTVSNVTATVAMADGVQIIYTKGDKIINYGVGCFTGNLELDAEYY